MKGDKEIMTNSILETAESASAYAEAASLAVEQKRQEMHEEYNRRKIKLIKFGGMVLLTSIIMIFATRSWFTMSREVEGTGVNMTAEGKDYAIKTIGNNGAYYSPYHAKILESEEEEASVWLVDSTNNLNNNINDGIMPGSSGTMTVYVTPLIDEITLEFTLQTVGYRTEIDGDSVEMTEMRNSAGEPAYFLSGHLLLFENKIGNYYTDFIAVDAAGKRKFSRTFKRSELSSKGVDTDSENGNDAFEVKIHWIWPETLDTLVFSSNSGAEMICDKDAVAEEGEFNDYKKVINSICNNPQYYLKGVAAGTVYTEPQLLGRNAMYNDADQDIGMNVEYVLLRLSADTTSGD